MIVPRENFGREVLVLADAFVLGGDAVNEAGILSVGEIVGRFVAKDVEIELQVDGVAGNAQVFKVSTEEADAWDVAFEGMFGDGLAYDAVGSDDLKDIEFLNDGSGDGGPSLVGLRAAVAGDLGMG